MENLEFKGTKGEWHIVNGRNNKFIYRRPESDLYERNGNNGAGVAGDRPLVTIHRAWIQDGKKGYPFEENAKLIAASPELLEANQENLIDLKILKTNVESELRVNPNGRWQGMDEQIQKWIERTEKAIEKALK